MTFINFTTYTIKTPSATVINNPIDFDISLRTSFAQCNDLPLMAQRIAIQILEVTNKDNAHIILDLPLWLTGYVEKALASTTISSVSYFDSESEMMIKSMSFAEFKRSNLLRSRLSELVSELNDSESIKEEPVCLHEVYLDNNELVQQVNLYTDSMRDYQERSSNAKQTGNCPFTLIHEGEALAYTSKALENRLQQSNLDCLVNLVR